MNVPQVAAAELLEETLRFVETQERVRSKVEAPWERTLPFVRLEFAWAFGRLGMTARAEELAGPALGVLREKRKLSWWERLWERAPRQGWRARAREESAEARPLISNLYELRLEQARSGASVVELASKPWSDIEAATPFVRYNLHRTVSVSRVLSPWTDVDGSTAFQSPGTQYLRPRVRNDSLPLDLLCQKLACGLPRNAKEWYLEWRGASSALTNSAASIGLDGVRTALDAYLVRWPRMTDNFNTNRLWNLSVLLFVDAVAYSIAETVNPLTPPSC